MTPRLASELRRIAALPRRAWLTLRHRGARQFAYRLTTFPLRLTPFRHRLRLGAPHQADWAREGAWYERWGRRVTVVIPTYGPPDLVRDAVRSIRRTTNPKLVRIIVVDDGSAPEHQRALRRLRGAKVILGETNAGFAANVNRGLAAVPEGDIVLLNSDVIAHEGWLQTLQHAARAYGEKVGIVGPKLLYPDGRIQSAGSHRNLGAPEWFDHRYRFQPADHGPANVGLPCIGVTGAAMYLRRDLLDTIGGFDASFPMAYEDADLCLRAWQAGFEVRYAPLSTLTHLESVTRGTEQNERELESQRRFWDKWGAFFDDRPTEGPSGGLRIVYVTEDTGVGGGHRIVFEHLNRLRARGHDAELYTLGEAPDWFPLEVPVHTFGTYDELVEALAPQQAIKVATWWNTALPVWRASVVNGVAAYFVQDIETSYYEADDPYFQHVLASYRQEFRYVTTSTWNAERLREFGLQPSIVPCAIDLDVFHLTGDPREESTLLALGRTHPLKNFPLTAEAWQRMPEPRPELCLFGVEPHLGERHGARYVTGPTDAEVNDLLNRAPVFVQTSRHEGFSLPMLEAMAAGAAVVCTDAHGNRDFCSDRVNCLMPEASPDAVSAALTELYRDPALRRRLAEAGLETARRYGWEERMDELEAFFTAAAGHPAHPPAVAASGEPAAPPAARAAPELAP